MNNKYLYKKILASLSIFILVLINSTNIFANFMETPEEAIEALKDFSFDHIYPLFVDGIKNKKTFDEYNDCRVIFDDKNEKLLIGCSPVVYMGRFADKELLKGYDIVGFGGTNDEDMLGWLKHIDKQYKYIYVWGAANNVFKILDPPSNYSMFDYEYVFNNLVKECRNKLNQSPTSKLIFIEIKDMSPIYDMRNYEYCDKYNDVAHKINDLMRNVDHAITIDINEYPTDITCTEWYIHFFKKEIHADILRKMVEAIKKS